MDNFLYDNFGNVVTDQGNTTLVPNPVTQSITPVSLGRGKINIVDGYLQSGNFVTGVSGWQINAAGDVEFSSGVFRLDLVGNTITGATFRTVATLPGSGTGVLINSSGFAAYNSGNPVFSIQGGVVAFYNPLTGVSSATIQGISASEIDIYPANGGGLIINTGYIAPALTASMTLGDILAGGWSTIYVGATQPTGGCFITSGTGSPNGVVTSSPGSLYLNKTGGSGTTLYVKESGSNTNTGWIGK